MRRPGLVVLLLGLLSARAGAQVRGVPLAAGGVPDGVAGSLDVAFPDAALGGGTGWAASLSFSGPRLAATAMTALVNHVGADAALSYGVRGEFVLLRSPTSPFQLLAFAGAGTDDVGDAGREWRIPAGMSFAFRTLTPGGTLVPWLAARVQWIDGAGSSDAHAGIGGGLDVALRARVGLRAAYDRLLRPGTDEATFGLGLTYTFTSRF